MDFPPRPRSSRQARRAQQPRSRPVPQTPEEIYHRIITAPINLEGNMSRRSERLSLMQINAELTALEEASRQQQQQRLETAEKDALENTAEASHEEDSQRKGTNLTTPTLPAVLSMADFSHASSSSNAGLFNKLPGELRNEIYSNLHYSDAKSNLPGHLVRPLSIGAARTLLPNKQLHTELDQHYTKELTSLFTRDNGAVHLPGGAVITWAFLPDDSSTLPSSRLYLATPVLNPNTTIRRSLRSETSACVFWQHGIRIRQTSLRPDYAAIQTFTKWLDSRECVAYRTTEMYKELKALLRTVEKLSRKLAGISAPPARAVREPLIERHVDVRFRWSYAEAGLDGEW
ncbi:uncharacterized protein CLAFUR5_10053 [Fulvia fulva]|uniref:Uncharacterized protein n=1 Tax=Passalora fulva TaxID=5499 RepID=A0A9Q8URU5_PASFU|nr:uncharacterized protein CLAFUR5_10053 [Fulvia fulva]UJO20081.1 hypothetical protein CLAFUR5_10053 [Fulvia fulva]